MRSEERSEPEDTSTVTSTVMGRPILPFVFGAWTLFGLLQASTWMLGPFDWAPWRPITVALVNAYAWLLLTPPILRVAARPDPGPGRRLRRYAIVAALGLSLSALVAAVATLAHVLLLPRPDRIGGLSWNEQLRGMSRWYFEEIVLFGVVFGAGLAIGVSRRYQAREREAAHLQAQADRLEAERARLEAQGAALNAQLAESRLAMIRTRFNPHFLFNTLNAVSALVAKDPGGVRDMIALLSELLRHALTDTQEQEISLREELKLVRLYLEIVEIRYQGQVGTVVEAALDVQDALVPNLVLQPLVENAMKHGIDRAGGRGTIEVRAWREGYDLVLTVRDTGPGDDAPARARSTGMGLQLTRDRLAELYGDEQTLALEPAPQGGTVARVALPYHTRADLHAAGLTS